MTRLDVGISSTVHAFIGSREARRRRVRAERPARAFIRGSVPAAKGAVVEAAAGDRRWRIVRRCGAGAGRCGCAAYDECEREPSHPSARARPQRTAADMSAAPLAARAAPGLGRASDTVAGLARATLSTCGLYNTQRLGRVLTPLQMPKMSEAPARRAGADAARRSRATRDRDILYDMIPSTPSRRDQH